MAEEMTTGQLEERFRDWERTDDTTRWRATSSSDGGSRAAADVTSRLERSRTRAASWLEEIARYLDRHADVLPGGAKVRDNATATAERLGAIGNYLGARTLSEMVVDLEAAVRRDPGAALLIAAGCGFVLARATTKR